MIIDGKKISREIRENLKERVSNCKEIPRMDIISLSQDKAIKSFVRQKKLFGEKIGVQVFVHNLDKKNSEKILVEYLNKILQETNGCIVQLPLPAHIDTEKILEMIPVEKDIDVLNPISIKGFASGINKSIPPVSGAIQEIIKLIPGGLKRKNIVIVGFGKLVGQPVTMLLDREGVNYHVIDKKTSGADKKEFLRSADIIISGTGRPHSIKPIDIREGVVLIDAGTSELAKKMVGDIHPNCYEKASLYTPVPGGVGPITIAILFKNLVDNICD